MRVLRHFLLSVVATLLVNPMTAMADTDGRKELVPFEKGATSTKINGSIKGYQYVDYELRAKAGQEMTIDLETDNLSSYFNVLPPKSNEAIFIGSNSGNHSKTVLPDDGLYTVRVYLMRNAARRKESANYEMTISIVGAAPVKNTVADIRTNKPKPSFDETYKLQGISFRVVGASNGSAYEVSITPSGLEIDNSTITKSVNGVIAGAEIADINVDGSPEVYVFIKPVGQDSKGQLVAYSSNNRKSLSEIYLPSIAENKAAAKGYKGHDDFAVVENSIVQRFPIYDADKDGSKPSGKYRQLQYKLVAGEAGWLLKLDKVVEY